MKLRLDEHMLRLPVTGGGVGVFPLSRLVYAYSPPDRDVTIVYLESLDGSIAVALSAAQFLDAITLHDGFSQEPDGSFEIKREPA
jgi:hypothetical protein